jgi:uncharacterized protein
MTMRFQCQPGCINCCTQKGHVYLTEEDIKRVAAYLEMTPKAFEKRYVYRTAHRRRLRLTPGTTCRFLKPDGCSIHPAKPTQCRIFPYWPELVDYPRAWFKAGSYCPGIGKGDLVQIEMAEEKAAEMRAAYPFMYR